MNRNSRRCRRGSWFSAIFLGLAGVCSAQNFNIDFGTEIGTPSSSYAAAANQIGTWNLIGSVGSQTLVGLDGFASNVSLSLMADDPNGFQTGRAGDIGALLNDNFYSNDGDSWSITISGLSNGTYNFYYYAPSNSAVSTGSFSVNGMPALNIPGDGSVEPLTQGLNWEVSQNVVVSDGTITVTSTDLDSYRGLAGIQLATVPEPQPLLLLGLGTLGIFITLIRRPDTTRS